MSSGDHDHQDIGDGDDAGLGRREPAGHDAAEQDHRDQHRQRRRPRRADEIAEARARPAKPGRPEEIAEQHQADADHQAGQDAGQEQPGDRDIADRAVDDRHDARRHQIGDGRGGGDQRGDEGRRVAFLRHRASHRPAQHRDVGRRRARHAGKEHAEHGGDLREPAADMADQRLRQFGDAHRSTFADVISSPTRRKNGIAIKRFRIDAVEQLPDDRLQRDRRQHRADDDARHQRKRHRHAEIAQRQEQQRHDQEDRAVRHRIRRRRSTAEARSRGAGR